MIYCIYLTKNPYEKLLTYRGEELDTPGCHLEFIGYYESYEDAARAMHAHLEEEHYQEGKHGGFIVNRTPGLYSWCTNDHRTFFLWDPDKKGFFEAEEPEIWKYVAI